MASNYHQYCATQKCEVQRCIEAMPKRVRDDVADPLGSAPNPKKQAFPPPLPPPGDQPPLLTTAPAAHNSDTQSNENLEDNMADIRERLLQWREDNRRDLIGLAPAVSCEPAPDTASAANTSSGSQKPKVDFAAAVVKYCGASCTGMGSKRSTAASDELVMCDHCGEPIPTFRNDQLEIRRLLKQGKCNEACEQRTSCLYELCYGIRGQLSLIHI